MKNRPFIMGVLNVTPDSFSDGGAYEAPEAATAKAQTLLDDGADVIDIGAESTRPGARPVTPDEEWQRLEPVLAKLSSSGQAPRLSVDTRHATTALKAAGYGTGWVNNIGGVYDNETLKLLARHPGLKYIAMHMEGDPQSMQSRPLNAPTALMKVNAAFKVYVQTLLQNGFDQNRIYVDPGIGFGKTDAANLALIGTVRDWAKDYQVLVGVSRKSFIGRLLEIPVAKERDSASKMLEFALIMQGARVVRTHDVKPLARICDVLFAENE